MMTAPVQGPTIATPVVAPTVSSPPVQPGQTLNARIAVPTREGIVVVDVPDSVVGHEHTHGESTPGRGFGALDTGIRGAEFAREQARIESTVRDVQARFAKLGVTEAEGNGPVKALFIPNFPNAAYAPEGVPRLGMPADSIGIGIDPRSGRSFAEAEDVIAHELAHRVVTHMARQPLSMSPISEDVAVHESLADTFAALIDDDQEWVLGEDLASPVRIMDRPEQLGHPGSVKDLDGALGPNGSLMVSIGTNRRTGEAIKAPDWHAVAGIPNKAASIIGKELGKEDLGKIYLNAIRKYVAPGQEIEGLARATMKSAAELYGANSRELQATKDAWDAVGVLELIKE